MPFVLSTTFLSLWLFLIFGVIPRLIMPIFEHLSLFTIALFLLIQILAFILFTVKLAIPSVFQCFISVSLQLITFLTAPLVFWLFQPLSTFFKLNSFFDLQPIFL